MLNDERILPQSRTFIPALLKDNPHLHDTNYEAILQGLPEPFRTQLLYGDFGASVQANPWQVLPTDHVRAAQKRWREMEKPETPLTGPIHDIWTAERSSTSIVRFEEFTFALLFRIIATAFGSSKPVR